ncbi:MAG: deoxynucleoside kinase [Myxococcota bacterium]|nr:deoxynucleoside kinase [Myxococcota bacterium]
MSGKIFVALAGNIGTGKSTAAEIIADHFDFDLYCEPVLENRFLRPYYKDMKRWSFTLQMEFLFKRLEHHDTIERARQSCVQDRSLIEDPEVFAKYLHGLGHMTDDELALYYDYFQHMNKSARQPDKLILLHTPDINVLLRRIAQRGREEESGITGTFLKGLNNYYEGFAEVARAKYELDVLVLDVTSRDIRKGEGRDWFIDQATAFFADRRQSSLF